MIFAMDGFSGFVFLVGFVSTFLLLLWQWRRAASLERSLGELHLGVRQLLRDKPVGACLRNSSLEPLWQSIRVLHEQRRHSVDLLPALSDVSSAANSLTIEAPESVGNLLASLRRVIPCRFVAAVVFDRERGSARIAAQEGLCDRRVEEHLLGRIESLLSHRLAEPIRDGTTVAAPLGSDGYFWIELENPSLPREGEAIIAAVAKQTALTLRLHGEAKEHSARLAFERDILLGISHDLRAPGSAALYAVRDLQTTAVECFDPEHRDKLQIIENALEEQLDVLANFLDLARIDWDEMPCNRASVGAHQTIEDCMRLFLISAERKGLTVTLAPGEALSVLCDASHGKRILSNLLSNAVKYTSTGSVTVSVSRRPPYVEISVKDTGPGISPDEAPRLFQRFSRLGSSVGTTGLGLGLSLSRALAERNGGYLRYEPNDPAGTTMILGLEEAKCLSGLPPLRSVLIVDDDEATRRYLGRVFRDLAGTVLAAGSRAEACELLEIDPPDLIITDLRLGDGNGWDILARTTIPSIIVTGEQSKNFADICSRRAHTKLVEKPIDRGAILAAVRQLRANSPAFLQRQA